MQAAAPHKKHHASAVSEKETEHDARVFERLLADAELNALEEHCGRVYSLDASSVSHIEYYPMARTQPATQKVSNQIRAWVHASHLEQEYLSRRKLGGATMPDPSVATQGPEYVFRPCEEDETYKAELLKPWSLLSSFRQRCALVACADVSRIAVSRFNDSLRELAASRRETVVQLKLDSEKLSRLSQRILGASALGDELHGTLARSDHVDGKQGWYLSDEFKTGRESRGAQREKVSAEKSTVSVDSRSASRILERPLFDRLSDPRVAALEKMLSIQIADDHALPGPEALADNPMLREVPRPAWMEGMSPEAVRALSLERVSGPQRTELEEFLGKERVLAEARILFKSRVSRQIEHLETSCKRQMESFANNFASVSTLRAKTDEFLARVRIYADRLATSAQLREKMSCELRELIHTLATKKKGAQSFEDELQNLKAAEIELKSRLEKCAHADSSLVIELTTFAVSQRYGGRETLAKIEAFTRFGITSSTGHGPNSPGQTSPKNRLGRGGLRGQVDTGAGGSGSGSVCTGGGGTGTASVSPPQADSPVPSDEPCSISSLIADGLYEAILSRPDTSLVLTLSDPVFPDHKPESSISRDMFEKLCDFRRRRVETLSDKARVADALAAIAKAIQGKSEAISAEQREAGKLAASIRTKVTEYEQASLQPPLVFLLRLGQWHLDRSNIASAERDSKAIIPSNEADTLPVVSSGQPILVPANVVRELNAQVEKATSERLEILGRLGSLNEVLNETEYDSFLAELETIGLEQLKREFQYVRMTKEVSMLVAEASGTSASHLGSRGDSEGSQKIGATSDTLAMLERLATGLEDTRKAKLAAVDKKIASLKQRVRKQLLTNDEIQDRINALRRKSASEAGKDSLNSASLSGNYPKCVLIQY